MLKPIEVQEHERTVVNAKTADLIRASVSKQTLTNYKRLIKQVEQWLGGRVLDDALLADYISMLHHDEGKAPATISQVAAAVSWRSKQLGQQIVGEITLATMAGIRREGADRGKGQLDGLTWKQVDVMVGLLSKQADNSWIEGRRIDSVDVRLPPPSGRSGCGELWRLAEGGHCGYANLRRIKRRQRRVPLCLRSYTGRSSIAIERRARSNVVRCFAGYERATM